MQKFISLSRLLRFQGIKHGNLLRLSDNPVSEIKAVRPTAADGGGGGDGGYDDGGYDGDVM